MSVETAPSTTPIEPSQAAQTLQRLRRYFATGVTRDAAWRIGQLEALKRMLNRLVGDLIANTQSRVNSAGVQTLDDVRSHPSRLAAFSPEVEAERKQAKDFLYENLYFSATLEPEKDAAEGIFPNGSSLEAAAHAEGRP